LIRPATFSDSDGEISGVNLFQSIFRGCESGGRYPESLIEAAIDRAVEGTDARLRLLPGYRKRLRVPVIHAIDQAVSLVDAIPAPLVAGRREHGEDPRLAAVFSSAADMLRICGRDPALTAFLATPEGAAAERVTCLLLAKRMERNILGMDLVGDQVLRRKRAALERGGWTFEEAQGASADPVALMADLDVIKAQLAVLGTDEGILRAHLGIVADSLAEAGRQFWAEELDLSRDAMNIRRDAGEPSARRIVLKELHNARGWRLVMLPLMITPGEIPPREDFVAAAERYL
jgi:hypothetical protein